VNGDGTANSIYNTLNDKDSELSQHFEEIYDMAGEDYPDFTQMQQDANDGQLIVGVLKRDGQAGHIVILMPQGMVSMWNGVDFRDEIALNSGEDIKEPVALECGTANDKRIKPLSGFGGVDTDAFQNIRWFKYTGL